MTKVSFDPIMSTQELIDKLEEAKVQYGANMDCFVSCGSAKGKTRDHFISESLPEFVFHENGEENLLAIEFNGD